MFETIKKLMEKHHLDLKGEFEWEVEKEVLVFRYHSTNSIVGVVTSRPMKVGQYVVDLLSFMECVSVLETNLVPCMV
jgi:hypothetical protein